MLYGTASDISQQVLRTDVAGMPLEWIDYREAVRLYHNEQVAYSCGTRLYTVFGGYSALDGRRSRIYVSSIIATEGTGQGLRGSKRGQDPSEDARRGGPGAGRRAGPGGGGV